MTDLPCHDASTLLTSSNDEDILGHGSYGMVRRCQSEELGEVAVKCFSVEGNEKTCRKVNENVERELAVLHRLGHDNIVKLLAKTEWNNCIGIIMEYVKGGSLENLLLDTEIEIVPWLLRIRLYYEVALALRYLHHHDNKRAYIHGDLKPQNILLTPELQVKVADFGSVNIATASRQTNRSINISSTSQHTSNYAAPEILRFPMEERKTSSDVYSFGIIGYEMITRKVAYGGAPIAIVEARIKSDGLKPDEKIIKEVQSSLCDYPEDFDVLNIVKSEMIKCWEYNPDLRPDINKVCHRLGLELEARKPPPNWFNIIEDVKVQIKFGMTRHSTSSKVALENFFPPFLNATYFPDLQQSFIYDAEKRKESSHLVSDDNRLHSIGPKQRTERSSSTSSSCGENQQLLQNDTATKKESSHLARDDSSTHVIDFQPRNKTWFMDTRNRSSFPRENQQFLQINKAYTSLGTNGPYCRRNVLVILLSATLALSFMTSGVAIYQSTPHSPFTAITECLKLHVTDELKMECTNNHSIGSVCNLTCTDGNVLKGNNKTECSDQGQWSSKLPTCTQKKCPVVRLSDGLEMKCTDDRKVGSACNFSCNGDTILQGTSDIICKNQEHWSSKIPSCELKECPVIWNKLDDLIKMHCTNANKVGSVCFFTCPGRFEPLSQNSMFCQKSQWWSSPLPVCVDKDSLILKKISKEYFGNFHNPFIPQNPQ